MTIRFDDALEFAIRDAVKARNLLAPTGESIAIVRDLTGRIRLFVDRETPDPSDDLATLESRLSEGLGAFSPAPGAVLSWRSGLLAPQLLHDSPEAWQPVGAPNNLHVIDRLVTGREWLLDVLPNVAPTPQRFVFFGIKGGVGRTAAMAMLAWQLSRQGRKVLAIDLDLESPGLGHALLPADTDPESRLIRHWPEFGAADWLVEDLVGQGDSLMQAEDLWTRSPLSGIGDIWVVPAAGGRRGQDYIGKLSRAYVDVPTGAGDRELFGNRIARFVDALESRLQPDVVLIDSRAGLHDISSALLTRLDAWCLLFAVDTRQTWEGLRMLFRHWGRKPEALDRLRRRLLTVAALVPEMDWETFRRGYCERAFDIFREIYDSSDDPTAPEEVELFTFDIDDPQAPHYPIRIDHHAAYLLFAPLERKVQVDESKARQVFGKLFDAVDELLLPEGATP